MRNLILSYVMLCLLCVVFVGCGSMEKEVVIPKETIQETLGKKFPIEHNAMVARMTLNSPEVYFKGQNIGVRLKYAANLLAKSVEGTVDFNGALVYKPKEGAFYLENVAVEKISANDSELAGNDALKSLVQNLISNYVAANPVYVLSSENTSEQLAKLLLKTITVRDNSLIVVLAPPSK